MSSDKDDETLEKYVALVRFLAGSLLEDDVDIEVRGRTRKNQWRIELLVPEEHRGRVIGRGGRIARAMRTLMNNTGMDNQQPVALDIVD